MIDTVAPDFEARSTHGRVRLSDMRGRWICLFSHPADFTPVCASEFIGFEKKRSAFEAEQCQLIGVSVDSVHAHLAWVDRLEQEHGVRLGFPLLEDVGMNIGQAFGMIHETATSTASMRSVFFIDPQFIIRAVITYPTQVGRSIDEVLRVLTALKATAKNKASAPAGWQPGDPLINHDLGELEKRFSPSWELK